MGVGVSIKRSLRKLLRRAVRESFARFGYEVRKAPRVGFKAAPIFDLAVQCLMLKRGSALRFIQVGANDGCVGGDPLRKYILQHGWTGVLVEPQPDVYEALKRNYAGLEDRLFFENLAITDRSTEVSLYRSRGDRAGTDLASASTVASLNPEVAAQQLRLANRDLQEIVVPAAKLDQLVEKYDLKALDILQVDTEGHDWQVLQTLDLATTKPTLIQFEHGHLSPGDIRAVTERLNAHDYLIYFGGHQSDSLAIHREFVDG